MANFRFGATALGLTFAAVVAAPTFAQDKSADVDVPSTEGVVSSEQSCEYEGGTVLDLDSGKICFIALRGADFATKTYDGQSLGVIKCSGNGAHGNELVQPSGQFCRIFLEQKKVAPSRAEVEAATRAQIKDEES
ncbi:MAG: hypothetical protein ABJG88_01610 [Litorimonas sp.]